MTALSDAVRQRMRERLTMLYGTDAERTLQRIDRLVADHSPSRHTPGNATAAELWNERDVVLITYGDQVRDGATAPLAALNAFLHDYNLQQRLSTLHLLPYFPWSSDDGFSVVDYRRVDPALGSWDDVARLGASFDLMFDLVLNHCSSHSEWFRKFREGVDPYAGYFIVPPDDADLSQVTRPRSTPLLTEFETSRGPQRVWTTFSADQVDLNFANPDVLLEMLDVLLLYVERGARIVRLDAIAYLWKEFGTSCIHLPQTHEVVKLMRDLLDAVAPGTILLTETNVPHAENVSYFGDGDEAQMVYQFSLAPLLLDALLTGDAEPLNDWLRKLDPPRKGTTFFNFTASHDGIGVRPLEGLVPQERLPRLVTAARNRGGLVSTRRSPDGTNSPYELNVTYFSALGDPQGGDPDRHLRRFLASQAIMLALQGVPAVYFHSLVGTPNDGLAVERSGHPRSINRRKFERAELDAGLAGDSSPMRRVFDGYRRLLQVRIEQPAFHPDVPQRLVEAGSKSLVVFERSGGSDGAHIVVAANIGDRPARFDPRAAGLGDASRDLISGTAFAAAGNIELEPYQVAWLERAS